MITTSGSKVYIQDRDIESAFRELLSVGFSPLEASEQALSLCIGRAEASDMSIQSLLYGQSDFPEELQLLGRVNSLLTSKELTTT
jgi:hypothetical protein